MSTSEKKLNAAFEDGLRWGMVQLSHRLLSGSVFETVEGAAEFYDKMAQTERRTGQIQGIVDGLRLVGVKDSVLSLVRQASNLDEVTRLLSAYNVGRAEGLLPAATAPAGPTLVHGVILTTAEAELAKTNKIGAIKEVRNRTKLGLKEALEVVNDYQRYLEQQKQEAA